MVRIDAASATALPRQIDAHYRASTGFCPRAIRDADTVATATVPALGRDAQDDSVGMGRYGRHPDR
jgi:hypothetical protein